MALVLPKGEIKVKPKLNKEGETTEHEINESKTEDAAEFVSYIFVCRNIVHMLHLKTKSFAAHKALDEYYNEVIPIIDSIAEVSQGYYGEVLSGYEDYPMAKYENYNPAVYLKEVREYVRGERYTSFPKDYSPIQNELDNLENLLNQTIYKLEQLS